MKFNFIFFIVIFEFRWPLQVQFPQVCGTYTGLLHLYNFDWYFWQINFFSFAVPLPLSSVKSSGTSEVCLFNSLVLHSMWTAIHNWPRVNQISNGRPVSCVAWGGLILRHCVDWRPPLTGSRSVLLRHVEGLLSSTTWSCDVVHIWIIKYATLAHACHCFCDQIM